MDSNKLKIVFSGMMAADPYQGGATWAVLQYVLGLRALGHGVLFVEPISRQAIRPRQATFLESDNAAYFCQVIDAFGLGDHAALMLDGTEHIVGMSYDKLHSRTVHADVLINVSGMLTAEELIAPIPIKVYLDLDPAFIQLWQTVQRIDMRFEPHTHFVTVGLAIGSPACGVPSCGREWIPTLQPIVLEQWPRATRIRHDALTTVGNWRGYGSIEHQGEFYGQKAHSLRQLLTLPQLVRENFLLAMAIHSDEAGDLEALSQHGWKLIDPREVAGTPEHYRSFIQHSKGELGIAKSGYVKSQCGWFSDRSVCYLAAGRPVIAQDTGFSRYLPTGEGLFAFSTTEDAARCIHAMNDDYDRHSAAARQLAETRFRSETVLPRLLQSVGAIA
jgi:hypothetical protein